jgi:hypothetical protein
MFPSLYGWALSHTDVDFVMGVRLELQKRRYPRDEEFRDSLMHDPVYGNGERVIRTRFLLETLERVGGHKEAVDLSKCTIEHILPQTIDVWWRQHLGDDYEEIAEVWLNTLGNLTLSAYNSELSNKPFPDKQKYYAESNLQLNHLLAKYPSWNADSIQHRADLLADQALEIWGDFRPNNGSPQKADGNVNGTKPYNLTIYNQLYVVKSWVDVLRETVLAIYNLAPEKMGELQDEFPSFISETQFRRCVPLPNNTYLNINFNADTVYRNCRKMILLIGLEEEDWNVLWE